MASSMRIPHPFLLTVTVAFILTSITYLEVQKPDQVQVEQTASDTYKEFVAPSGFINTDAFDLSDYIGKKVILIDFWAYSCINCQRTQPYLNAWWDAYQTEGLLIIGIHTPEFEFEKDYDNVLAATKKFEIEYPVVLDNDKGTWNAYQNRYWPRKYLIDLNGKIIYDHIGEGSYQETEEAIKKALGIKGEDMSSDSMNEVDLSQINSPEVYFGTLRNEYLANGEQGKQGVQTLSLPTQTKQNELYLEGTWDFNEEYAEMQSAEGGIVFEYDSKDVYMVASAEEKVTLEIYVDNVLIKTIEVQEEDLYPIVEGNSYDSHHLEIRIKGRGLRAFTFTFG